MWKSLLRDVCFYIFKKGSHHEDIRIYFSGERHF